MIFAGNVGSRETTAGDMKSKKPLRKISEKRRKEIASNGLRLGYNSTIRRKPCNAITAEKKSSLTNLETLSPMESGQTHTDSYSAGLIQHRKTFHRKPVKKYLNANFGKKLKPINRQSTKQKARLQKLAAIRLKWWNEAQSRGKTLICGICDEPIWTFEDLASDHIIPGNPRDDSESNLQPANQLCNLLKGSQRNFKIVRGDRNWKLIHGML